MDELKAGRSPALRQQQAYFQALLNTQRAEQEMTLGQQKKRLRQEYQIALTKKQEVLAFAELEKRRLVRCIRFLVALVLCCQLRKAKIIREAKALVLKHRNPAQSAVDSLRKAVEGDQSGAESRS